MGAVEQFFGAAGWTLAALGLASCLIPHCFKRGVVVMLAGDLCLFLGIVMPRSFMGMAFFQGSFGLGRTGYHACGIAVSAILFALFMGPHVVKIWKGRRLAAPAGAGGAGNADAAAPAGEGRADPALFSKVRQAAAAKEPADQSLDEARRELAEPPRDGLSPDQGKPGAGLHPGSEDFGAEPSGRDPREDLFSGLGKGDRPL